ncbi:WD domain G-beta repeat uncharacterized protein [Murinocardiopsis flavida]|uniref:WD domain G-beta repeat uncharacterized protein n=1 Tax=Murinocardiopsis flavida TaxID=645275 RepID=A0A2P8DSG1_9ACTN|nr:serine/threonine-protein kinase [Murinocardiopsis flavida]PSL00159.1 WD domain G-beta repeat uncharacterized protein [Murinocardiopsis flavida]
MRDPRAPPDPRNGNICRAHSHGRLGRLVAIKVIRPEFAEESDYRRRFAREVAIAQRVSGAFSADVIQAAPGAVQPWLVTSYVPGPTLRQAVAKSGPLDEGALRVLALGMAEALRAIHAAGLVHRDLKPGNILLVDEGPRVIDFGIARSAEASVVTQEGGILGTPGFMSPEQAYGHELTGASDVFSLGSVLCYAATGREPFGTGTVAHRLSRIATEEPDTEGIPEWLRAPVLACMAKDPERRPTPERLLHGIGGAAAAPGGSWLPPAVREMIAAQDGGDGVIRYWESRTGDPDGTLDFPGSGTGARAVDWSPKGDRLATVVGGKALVYDPDDPQDDAVEIEHGQRTVEEVVFNHDGSVIATGGTDATVQLWDTATGANAGELTGPKGSVMALEFSPDGSVLVSSHLEMGESSTAVWNLAKGTELTRLEHNGDAFYANDVAFNKDGTLFTAGAGNGRIILWELPG